MQYSWQQRKPFTFTISLFILEASAALLSWTHLCTCKLGEQSMVSESVLQTNYVIHILLKFIFLTLNRCEWYVYIKLLMVQSTF